MNKRKESTHILNGRRVKFADINDNIITSNTLEHYSLL